MPRKAPPKSSNVQAFSVREFFERFPTGDSCLEHLMGIRYGLRHPCAKCGQDVDKWGRSVAGRRR